MCGIAGFNWKDEKLIVAMMDSMVHRGPDDSGKYSDEKFTLGHRRLSIIDLSSSGHQPMFYESKGLWIAYNGEIYNYEDLRNELSILGHTFKTKSDTEVILHAYNQWGHATLHKFKGMFAFAIYDSKNNSIFLARDHVGIKPLFYHLEKDKFIFASTISALLLHKIPRNPNRKMIRDYLLYNITDHCEDTFFKDIKRFPKGHYAIFDLKSKKITFHKWWEIKFTNDYSGTYEEAVTELRKLLIASVERHLISDVPVGTCLSGGIDSTSIACLINDSKKSDIKTFSAVFPNYQLDETGFIDIVTKKTGMENHVVKPSVKDLNADFNAFVKWMDVPIHNTSPYAQYKVFQLAKNNGVTVLLDGQGADELLAGYHYFYGFYIRGLLKKGKLGTALKEIVGLIKGGHYSIGIKSLGFGFMPLSTRNNHFIRKSNISKELLNDKEAMTSYFEDYYSTSTLHDALKFHLDYKIEHLLSWEDKNSMAHSMEGRVPFLDVDVINFISKLPEDYIISDGITKKILRDAMNGIVPEEILLRRDKIGFDTPGCAWLREPSAKPLLDMVTKEKSRCSKYIDINKTRKMIKDTISGKQDFSTYVWKAILLEKWLDEYVKEV